MMHVRFERAADGSRTARLVSGMLALLLVLSALFGIAAPAQAAPPHAPTIHLYGPASGIVTNLSPLLESGSAVTDISAPEDLRAALSGGANVTIETSQLPTFPDYRTRGSVEYEVTRDGETARGVLNVTFAHKPWVFAAGLNEVVVAPGETVELRVEARGEGFVGGEASGTARYELNAQPSSGTAQVATSGVVTYSAPADAAPGSSVQLKVSAYDLYGQRGETYQPLTFKIKGTAEADTFSVDIPYGTGRTTTWVGVVPDHARGVDPKLDSVDVNPNNASVAFSTTGIWFTSMPRSWGHEESSIVFAAPYTIVDDNGSADGQINVRVLRPPVITSPEVVHLVPAGGSSTATVAVLNDPVIPASGGYSILTQPSIGTANVTDAGVVTFTAPDDMQPDERAQVVVRVIDKVGQFTDTTLRFEAYERASAPDITVEQPDSMFELQLLEGAAGEGRTLRDVRVTSGDATLAAELASGTAEVTPSRAWGVTEATHEIVLAYTVEDAHGGSDTGTVTITVLRPPVITAPSHIQPVLAGSSASVTLQVLNASAIPATGGYGVVSQPSEGTATVDDRGVVSFAAPADMQPGETAEVVVRVTDRAGQSATTTIEFMAYESAAAPDVAGEQADATFDLDLLGGASGEGKALSRVTLVSGDAVLAPDLTAGTVRVVPAHSWNSAEARHEIVLSYTVEDAEGGADTATVTITVLPKPAFLRAAPGDLAKTVRVGERVTFDAQVRAPGNLPEAGAYAVTSSSATLANAIAVGGDGTVAVDTEGLAAGSEHEFTIRVTDRVGQAIEQRFTLALAPAKTDPETPRPEPTSPEPTEPGPTESEPTSPEPTESEPTEPGPTEPEPTESESTYPRPTGQPDPDGESLPQTGVDTAGLLLAAGAALLLLSGGLTLTRRRRS